MNKLRIYIDMDGVLADFKSAADELKKKLPMNSENLKFDEILDFSTFKPMKDAIDDTDYRGQKDFQGTWMHFDPSEGADWNYTVKKIEEWTNNSKIESFNKAISQIQ